MDKGSASPAPQCYDPFRGSETFALRELLEDIFEDLIDFKEIEGDPFIGREALTVETRTFGDEDLPLHVVAQRGNVRGVRLLLAAGADPNSLGDMSMTPLHYAVSRGHYEAAKLLIEAGARTDLVDEFDSTPLSRCSPTGFKPNAEIFAMLSKG